ncbi:MAG: CBS domain-containing protein [Acidobacteriia bacterium]|nr:CBS domain-containing protein [Terriglobia bacterium]
MQSLSGILSEREMYSVDETQTVAEVVRRMAFLHVGAILVLGDGALRGIFSERDLMTRVVVERLDAACTRVGEVMTTNLATIDEQATVSQAMETMGLIGCRHLPVLRHGRVVGMVSMRDLMGVELARKTEEIEHMRAYIHGST